ncbi:hypothetical protein IFR05_006366 [Cadophora sp. M221]|nr:hypothetical protein IFR05_006366 [Cadophora sp. M221]
MGSMKLVLGVAMISRCFAATGPNPTSDVPLIKSNSLGRALSDSLVIIPVTSDTGVLTEAASLESTTHSSKGSIYNLDNVREVTVVIIRTVDMTILPDWQLPTIPAAMTMETEIATEEELSGCPDGKACASVVGLRREFNGTSSSAGQMLFASRLTVL